MGNYNDIFDNNTILGLKKHLDNDVLFMELSADGKIISTNSLLLSALGYFESEVILHHISDFLENETKELHTTLFTDNKEKYNVRINFLTKENKIATLQTSIIPVFNNEILEKSLVFASNVTRIKELEDNMGELNSTMEFLQSAREEIIKRELILAGIYEAIDFTSLSLDLDINGEVTKANNLFLKTLGHKYQNVINKSFFEFISSPDLEGIKEAWESVVQGMFYNTTISLTKKDFTEIQVIISFTPVRDIDGDICSIIVLANILP